MIFFLFSYALALECLEFQQEQQMISYFSSAELVEDSCILHALDKNWYEAAYQVVLRSVYEDREISTEIKEKLGKIKGSLENLSKKAENLGKFQVVSPAFQWAQSPKQVFLDIKFSHRLDAPGCTGLEEPVVNITAEKFLFMGKCTKVGQKIKLLLEFEFFGKVNAEKSSYSFTKNGRLNVVLTKKRGDIWELPLKGKKPKNLHIWWEIKEKYAEEIEKITGGDDIVDSKDDKLYGDIMNNPNVVVKNSYINGKYVDNSEEGEDP